MDDEKPLDLRDKLALDILNGVLSNPSIDKGSYFSDVAHYVEHCDVATKKAARERVEKLIRSCYAVADIIRKVRLSAFE